MVRRIVLASLVILLPAGVQAQRHAAISPAFHPAAVGPRLVVQAPRVGPPRVGPAQVLPRTRTFTRVGVGRPRTATPVLRGTRRQFSTRGRFDFDNGDFRFRSECNSAPGFGFDAAHQAAICGSTTFGLGTRGLGFPFFFPFFDGGFSIPSSPAAVAEGSTVEAQQQEEADAEPLERGRRSRVIPQVAPPAAEAASSTPAENEEFVFVRRDGTVFFAVAYAWEKGTLRYITSQGLRRTVTQDALDLDATQQFNEQRGLNFRSPA
jgi:hypothetical protein